MSYDLAVWEGPSPSDDVAALAEFQRRYDSMVEGAPPSPKIAKLVEALTDKFRDPADLEDHEIDVVDTPWASGPLINGASGDFFYFGMTFSGAEAHLEEVVRIVLNHGLVCFDPQGGNVYTLASLAPPSMARQLLRTVNRRLEQHVTLIGMLLAGALGVLLSKCAGG